MSKAINAADAPPQAGPYSHAVQTGNLVFLAGQGPFDPSGGPRPETFEEQARLTFRNAAPVGAAEGTGGAIAVLWLPEHAPTATGSFPMLRTADERQPQG